MNNKRRDAIHRVLKITITIICIALAYTELSAQSKGFNDTVILKNGTVLTGVKAVVTKDSLVVTTSEGETSVFTKKEVSEVKKSGGGNGEKSVKTETKATMSDGKWSEYQGKMNLNDAIEKCSRAGMRLPSVEEFKSACNAKMMESWKWVSEGENYWVVDPSIYIYGYNILSCGKFSIEANTNLAVRCIR